MLIFITGNFAIVAIYRTNPIKESSLPICHRCKVRIRTYTIERKIKNWREMKVRERERERKNCYSERGNKKFYTSFRENFWNPN